MDADWNILGPGGLEFFAKITATTTHELNNFIGIINENAGLLEDLGEMAKQGGTPDIDRWTLICQKIMAQVKRAHETINRLNRFAHSADPSKSWVNPDTLLTLIISLSTRILAEKNVSVQLIASPESMDIYTFPSIFLQLMGSCLFYAKDHADPDKKIVIHTRNDTGKSHILFSGICVEKDRTFPGKFEQELLNLLDGKLKFQTDKNSLTILMDTKTN